MDTRLSLSWEKIKVISIAIASIAVPLVVAVVGTIYSKDQKEKEIGMRYVEMATEILQSPPTAESKVLRRWAVNIIDYYAVIPIPPEAKENLEFMEIKLKVMKEIEMQTNMFDSLNRAHERAMDAIRKGALPP